MTKTNLLMGDLRKKNCIGVLLINYLSKTKSKTQILFSMYKAKKSKIWRIMLCTKSLYLVSTKLFAMKFSKNSHFMIRICCDFFMLVISFTSFNFREKNFAFHFDTFYSPNWFFFLKVQFVLEREPQDSLRLLPIICVLIKR